MLPGLDPLELGRLRLSVGYGTHKKGRPLSPIEVGLYIQKACNAGATLNDCAKELRIDGTNIGRFLRILSLPADIQYLINWGSGKDFIGFSYAFELVRLEDADDQRFIAKAILANGLRKTEIQQVVQLRTRSKRPICDCLKEVIDMRSIVERRYVFIGSLNSQDVEASLFELTQKERDAILDYCIKQLGLLEVSGRLGYKFFTLVGGNQFNESMKSIGKENIESQFQTWIAVAVEDVQTSC